MAKFRRRESKRTENGPDVILCQDIHDGSWCIGRVGDRALDPIPLGAFCSAAAARAWADSQFRGGSWHPTRATLYQRR